MAPILLRRLAIYHERLIGWGGAERLLFEEARYFLRRGVETEIVTSDFNLDVPAQYRDLKVVVLGKGNNISRGVRLRRYLASKRPDLCIAATGRRTVAFAAFPNVPYVFHIHGSLYWFPHDRAKYALIHRGALAPARTSVPGHLEFIPAGLPPMSPVKRVLYSDVNALIDYISVRRARKLVVLSEQMRWEVKALYRKDPSVCRGCVSADLFGRRQRTSYPDALGFSGRHTFLSLNRLDPRKRVDLVIRAFADLLSRRGDVALVVAGTGPDRSRLESLAEDLGIGDSVRFVGFVPDEDVPDYYSSCEVYVSAAWDSRPMTAYEALALGAKVVWTDENRVREPIMSDPGVFAAEPSVAGVSGAMERAIAARVGRSDLSAYTWDRYFGCVCDSCGLVLPATSSRTLSSRRRT